MNTNSGIEISTSLVITEYARCTKRSSVCRSASGEPCILYAANAKMMPMPISVKAVGNPSMIATTMSDSMSRPRWPCVICEGEGSSRTVASTTAAMMISPNQTPFCMLWVVLRDVRVELLDVLVLHLHHRLELVDVHFLDVLLARGPCPLPDADGAARDLDQPLDQQERTRDRDEGLERIDRRPVRHDRGVFLDGPGVAGVDPAGVGERDHAGNEEQDVE